MIDGLQRWVHLVALAAGAAALGLLVHYAAYAIAGAVTKRYSSPTGKALVKYSRAPTRILFPLVAIRSVLPFLDLSAAGSEVVEQTISLLWIASLAWLLVRCVDVLQEAALTHYGMDATDNLRARKIQTQVKILKRILVVVVSIVAIGLMLMTFSSVRAVGTSILASAGIVGIVVGFAAQKTLGNLLASVQIAITEPIRIEDVVVVENEWGWVEEITFTYVVVRTWDLRRLIVPMSTFIEKPFQNWTRTTTLNLLATVFIYADYSIPVQPVREELQRILQSTDKWDGKTWGLQVTNATERTIELRALMSAFDAGTAWDLRCLVREKLIEFIQTRFPEGLPKVRAHMEAPPAIDTAGRQTEGTALKKWPP